MQTRLDVRRLADELVHRVASGAPDPRLEWSQDGTVAVRMGTYWPAAWL
jgi:hypothetical protein